MISSLAISISREKKKKFFFLFLVDYVLLHQRWEIEIANDEIATHQLATVRPTELRSKNTSAESCNFISVLLAHNAIRALMHEAALTIDVDPRTLRFMHAVRVVRETIPLMRASPAVMMLTLYTAMICHEHGEIASARRANRPCRSRSRCRIGQKNGECIIMFLNQQNRSKSRS